MADYVPRFLPGQVVSLTVGATAVVGGNVVMLSGDNLVVPATNGVTTSIGVAGADGAIGALIPVYTAPGTVHRLTANGAIAAGAIVIPGVVAGSVKTIGAGTFDQKVGKALAAIADLGVGPVIWLP